MGKGTDTWILIRHILDNLHRGVRKSPMQRVCQTEVYLRWSRTYFGQALKSLTYISVREERLAQAVEKLTGREVTTVVDPTLLLERADYEDLLYKEPLVAEKYILAYFCGRGMSCWANAQKKRQQCSDID